MECTRCHKAAARRANVLWPFLQSYSSLREELLGKSFDNFKERPSIGGVPRAFEAAKSFSRKPEGWLVLSGLPGLGKTHLAAAIANELLRRHQLVLFLNVPELLGFLRAGFNANLRSGHDPDFETRLQTIKAFPILILDDWGAHSDTPWADEQLYMILNFRTDCVLPTVVTTNLHLEDLEPRVSSRLRNRRIGKIIEITVPENMEDVADFRLGPGG